MGKTLRGAAIVGYFNDDKGDFEGHNRSIEMRGNEVIFKDTTQPYGFVPTDAQVWFEDYEDDGVVHTYLMTEGYLWTTIYPEVSRVLTKGNNQSMELENVDGEWSENENSWGEFFIINEAVISKLCILGEDVEPCFEGAGISQHYSLSDGFKQSLYSMAEELKTILNSKEGISEMPNENQAELENVEFEQKSEEEATPSVTETTFEEAKGTEEVAEAPAAEFATEEAPATEDSNENEESAEVPAAEEFAAEDTVEEAPAENVEEPAANFSEEVNEEEASQEDVNEAGNSEVEENVEEDKTYSLEEIPEYVDLSNKYSELSNSFAELQKSVDSLTSELTVLREFKAAADRAEKQKLIDSFSMLSDEDKKDVVENMDKYSLDDIESKLAVLCYRQRINFNESKKEEVITPTTYSLDDQDVQVPSIPAWVQAVLDTEKSMN